AQERLTSTRSSPSSTLSLSTSTSTSSSTVSTDRCAGGGGNNRPFRSTRRCVPEAASDAPAPEYLARSLLQLGCPAVSMPTPRGGVGSEQPPSSDSDDYTTAHHQQQGAGYGQNLDGYTVPKVKVSSPPNVDESASIINGLINNKDNISTALRISRTCKNCLLANYEIVLHRLRIKRSVLCDEQISCMCHEEEAHLQKHESTSKW
ncbi:hypothetical protein ALC60_00738, partial [Trachymyrmex zeteki]